jgi:hypothetical protein
MMLSANASTSRSFCPETRPGGITPFPASIRSFATESGIGAPWSFGPILPPRPSVPWQGEQVWLKIVSPRYWSPRVYGVFAVKVLFVRSRSYPGWVLPLAGGTLFAVLTGLWLSSSLWYLTQVRFGF